MKLPEQLEERLKEEGIFNQSFKILKLDDAYKLLNLAYYDSKSKTYTSIDSGKIGQPLEKVYLFLEGTIPEKDEFTFLPNLEISSGQYANITIYTESSDILWVILVNNTDAVNELRKTVQSINQSIFEQKADPAPVFSQRTGIGLLNAMGYAVFEKLADKNQIFQLIGNIPEWLNQLTKDKGVQWDAVDLPEIFPYIEVFVIEAQHLWHKDRFAKTASSVWTEFDGSGEEHFLQAFAANLNENDYILIGQSDMIIEEKQNLIQKAREKSLDYERLEKAETALKRMVMFKDRFVSMVSHDLRAPLGMLAQYTNRIAQNKKIQTALDTRNLKSLHTIDKELHRLSNYIDKLYYWSNLELGILSVNIKTIDLQNLVLNSVQIYESKLSDKNLSVQVDVPADTKIEVDESLFEQVINNLFANAIKFSHKGGKISIKSSHVDGFLILSVKDEGVGMSKEFACELFNNEFSAHSLGTEGEIGSGFGLQICKQIIDVHQFTLDILSEEGIGTEAHIKIPKT